MAEETKGNFGFGDFLDLAMPALAGVAATYGPNYATGATIGLRGFREFQQKQRDKKLGKMAMTLADQMADRDLKARTQQWEVGKPKQSEFITSEEEGMLNSPLKLDTPEFNAVTGSADRRGKKEKMAKRAGDIYSMSLRDYTGTHLKPEQRDEFFETFGAMVAQDPDGGMRRLMDRQTAIEAMEGQNRKMEWQASQAALGRELQRGRDEARQEAEAERLELAKQAQAATEARQKALEGQFAKQHELSERQFLQRGEEKRQDADFRRSQEERYVLSQAEDYASSSFRNYMTMKNAVEEKQAAGLPISESEMQAYAAEKIKYENASKRVEELRGSAAGLNPYDVSADEVDTELKRLASEGGQSAGTQGPSEDAFAPESPLSGILPFIKDTGAVASSMNDSAMSVVGLPQALERMAYEGIIPEDFSLENFLSLLGKTESPTGHMGLRK